MKASNNAFDIIKGFEGLRLDAYKCPAGVPTIGYGHTQDVNMGQKITLQEAEKLLQADVLVCEKALKRLVKVDITQNQYDALIDFVFNLGSSNLGSSTLLKLINNNPNDPAIKNQFLRWKYSGGKETYGLLRRREKEVELYFKK